MTETDKISLMHAACEFLAKFWKRTYAPVSHEETIFVDGDWVKVTVDFDYTRGPRKPARRAEDRHKGERELDTMHSERSQDG